MVHKLEKYQAKYKSQLLLFFADYVVVFLQVLKGFVVVFRLYNPLMDNINLLTFAPSGEVKAKTAFSSNNPAFGISVQPR